MSGNLADDLVPTPNSQEIIDMVLKQLGSITDVTGG